VSLSGESESRFDGHPSGTVLVKQKARHTRGTPAVSVRKERLYGDPVALGVADGSGANAPRAGDEMSFSDPSGICWWCDAIGIGLLQ
jgi:hypothetical protein